MLKRKQKEKSIQEQEKVKMIAYFEPFENIGDFRIGADIKSYLGKYNYELSEDEYDTGQDTYNFKHFGVSLFVNKSNGVIESILSDEECLYKGRNVIGMSLDEFIVHSNSKYVGEPDCLDFQEDNVPQYVYEFEDIGLQVWTKSDQIVTVIATSNDEEE